MPDLPAISGGGESGRRAQYLLDILGTTDRLPPPPPDSMYLTYYPEGDFYLAGSYEKGFSTIDKDSSAFSYCEYLRSNFGVTEAKDPEGDFYLVIQVSEYRIEQIHAYVSTENIFRYLMANGL